MPGPHFKADMLDMTSARFSPHGRACPRRANCSQILNNRDDGLPRLYTAPLADIPCSASNGVSIISRRQELEEEETLCRSISCRVLIPIRV